MIFTDDEKRLLFLYYSGNLIDTAHVVRYALNDITDPGERAAAESLLRKIKGADEAAADELGLESESVYG